MVGPAHRLGAVQLAQRPVKGPDGDAIGLGRTGDDLGATGVAWGQQRQPSAKIDQSLSRRSLRPVSHRSEERREGNECVSTGRTRGGPSQEKKKKTKRRK